MFLRVCALPLRDGRCQGRLAAQPASVSLDLVCIPSTQRSEAQSLCACVRPNHSNSSTGLQHQQQQQCSFASVVPNPGAAAGKPYSLAVGTTCNVPSNVHTPAAVVQQYQPVRKCNSTVLLISTIKWALNFRTEWNEGVAPCSDF